MVIIFIWAHPVLSCVCVCEVVCNPDHAIMCLWCVAFGAKREGIFDIFVSVFLKGDLSIHWRLRLGDLVGGRQVHSSTAVW